MLQLGPHQPGHRKSQPNSKIQDFLHKVDGAAPQRSVPGCKMQGSTMVLHPLVLPHPKIQGTHPHLLLCCAINLYLFELRDIKKLLVYGMHTNYINYTIPYPHQHTNPVLKPCTHIAPNTKVCLRCKLHNLSTEEQLFLEFLT